MSESLHNTPNPTSERVFRALREARSQLEAMEQARHERVAIIGMAGRFPGADNLSEFWDLLVQGKSGVRLLSEEELLAAGTPESAFKQSNYVPAYASFTDPTQFDARFFGYSPREAELMDPQHRVFLECAWTALEDAGYDSLQYDGAIGVYGGAALNSYVVNLRSNPAVWDSVDPVQVVVSNVMGLMPTRVSYQLDLKGPSCGVQTGCSTALTAIHTACQSLLNHECDMALAGGVTVSSATPQGYLYQENSIAAPDGVCRAFDARGRGTLFGNGVGIVVLKRLQAALRDGDHVYAVIKGSAINNDGADKVGLTAPSVSGQAAVIQAAIEQAGVDPATISYIEAHGTGTPLGDPIEIAALNKVFAPSFRSSPDQPRCPLGSVKTNLGHLDAAAGVAGVIKTALALKYQTLPPSLNFEQPNPQIDFEHGPFFVNRRLTNWVGSPDAPRRAGVSSFGMGGTNGHMILEEAPAAEAAAEARPWQLVMLSAKTPTALQQMTQQLAEHLKSHPDSPLSDVAYTLQIGRRPWPHRLICLCQTTTEAMDLLNAGEPPQRLTAVTNGDPRSIVFMFSGQGSQHINMARDLYETESVFRQTVDQCCEILASDFPLLEMLYPEAEEGSGKREAGSRKRQREEKSSTEYRIYETACAQPALFVIEYALAKLWMAWGIEPQALIGHSVGEYVAACLAGVFSLKDALYLMVKRGRLMQGCAPGSMLSVMQSAEVLHPQLPTGAEIAVINSPETCVVSGPMAVIEDLRSQLETKSIPCRLLETSHAFHSALMEPALAEFAQVLQGISLHPPQLDIISNATGVWLTEADATNPYYWVHHLRHTVRFSQGVTELLQLPNPVFLEVGPGDTLTKFVQQHAPPDSDTPVLQSLPHPREAKLDAVTLMTTLGKLWLAGVPVSWTGFHQSAKRHRLPLPTYPFERESYWIPLVSAVDQPVASPKLPAKAADLADWFYLPTWRRFPLTHQPSETLNQCWLVFADKSLQGRLQTHLESVETVKQTIWVKPGSTFSHQGDTYTLNPHHAPDYESLIQALQTAQQWPTQVIYGWGTTEITTSDDSILDTFKSLLYLTQALMTADASTELTLSVLTTRAQAVTDADSLDPKRARVIGLCQAIPQEYPGLRCRQIDIVEPITDSAGESMMMQGICQELSADYSLSHRMVAYRNGDRWLQTYEPIPLPERQPSLLKANGVYLIAGDLVEGLGMVYAQSLVQDFNARLILIGRPGLPAASDWEKWLVTHSPQHGVSRLIRKLQSLGVEGETFLWFSGCLADVDWLQARVRQGIDHFGSINGVFHADAMGDQASCLLADLSDQACDRICRSKIQGLQALQQVLANHVVDFYLLQSSLSSIVGGVGFGAYAAANAYLDAVAHQHHRAKTRWYSLNWDACQLDDAIENTGSMLMASAMSASEVWQATQRALAQPDCPQIVISPRNLQARLQEAFTPSLDGRLKPARETLDTVTSSSHARPALSTPYVAPRHPIEQTVAQVMGDLLGIESVGIHDNFFELGGHSLLAIQAVTQLRKEFQVELPMRAFLFEAPTVAGIAKIIADNQITLSAETQSTLENLLDQIEGMTPEEVEQQL